MRLINIVGDNLYQETIRLYKLLIRANCEPNKLYLYLFDYTLPCEKISFKIGQQQATYLGTANGLIAIATLALYHDRIYSRPQSFITREIEVLSAELVENSATGEFLKVDGCGYYINSDNLDYAEYWYCQWASQTYTLRPFTLLCLENRTPTIEVDLGNQEPFVLEVIAETIDITPWIVEYLDLGPRQIELPDNLNLEDFFRV